MLRPTSMAMISGSSRGDSRATYWLSSRPAGMKWSVRSAMRFQAPTGPHDWLNKAVFVGTLNAPGDATAPVVIRCFEVI